MFDVKSETSIGSHDCVQFIDDYSTISKYVKYINVIKTYGKKIESQTQSNE